MTGAQTQAVDPTVLATVTADAQAVITAYVANQNALANVVAATTAQAAANDALVQAHQVLAAAVISAFGKPLVSFTVGSVMFVWSPASGQYVPSLVPATLAAQGAAP